MAKKKVTELTVERVPPIPDEYSDAPQYFVVHVGDHVIEATATDDEIEAASWIGSAMNDARQLKRRNGGPMIVSLCAFKGLPEEVWDLKGPKSKKNSNHPLNPYRAISICVAGFGVLVYRLTSYWRNVPNVKPLLDLLDSNKVVVVGMGIKEIAKKLEIQWGLRVSRPLDIRKVAASAYRKDAVYWLASEKGRVVIENLELEELGELALDGMLLKKKPAQILEADWGKDGYFYDGEIDEENELIMYASRDAFLCYEVAVKCLKKSGLHVDRLLW